MNWEQIYIEYQPALMEMAARGIGERSDLDAIDVVHDVFAAAISDPSADESSLQDLLAQLTAKMSFGRVNVVLYENVVPVEDSGVIAIRRLNASEMRRRILRVMDCMTDRQREIAWLLLFEGLSAREIATRLNTSFANVSQILTRCLNRLAPILAHLETISWNDLEQIRPLRQFGQ